MTCKDFQQKWNELLDAEAGVAGTPRAAMVAPYGARSIEAAEALLLAHAAGCPVCRPIAVRYQTLRRAIRAWRQPPAPPADLVHRVLSVPDKLAAVTGSGVASPGRRFWQVSRDRVRRLSRTRIAAALLLFVMLAFVLYSVERGDNSDRKNPATPAVVGDPHSISGPPRAAGDPPALDRALAEATSATWDLARSASEPAARIGREVLDATTQNGDPAVVPTVRSSALTSADPDEGLAALSLAVPSLDPLRSDAAEASAVLQQVGDHLSAGVQPLSSTARHAFGFLFGSPPAGAGSSPDGSTSSGARSG
jgi:hypothetical protein